MRFTVAQLAATLLETAETGTPGPSAAAARTRAAGRLMTLLENEPYRLPELYQALAAAGEPTDRLQPQMLVGITGAPGSGKSTLTDALVAAYRSRYPEQKIGVIAVDPSSPFTGGAVLGDRVRMMRHATDPMVYVRSMASRGRLGGLSLGVKGVVRVMALAGCSTVLLETVGVGQSEVEVVRVADLTLVVLAPGQGDSVQMLKAGLMEAGDAFVVNKADREGANVLYSQLVQSLQMGAAVRAIARPGAASGQPAAAGPTLPIGTCHADDAGAAFDELGMQARKGVEVHLVSAQDGTGIDGLLESLEHQRQAKQRNWAGHRDRALHEEIREAVLEAGRARLAAAWSADGAAAGAVDHLMQGRATVDTLADELLRRTAGAGSTPPPRPPERREPPPPESPPTTPDPRSRPEGAER